MFRLFRNIMRDEETAKLCEELRAMREKHEEQEKVSVRQDFCFIIKV